MAARRASAADSRSASARAGSAGDSSAARGADSSAAAIASRPRSALDANLRDARVARPARRGERVTPASTTRAHASGSDAASRSPGATPTPRRVASASAEGAATATREASASARAIRLSERRVECRARVDERRGRGRRLRPGLGPGGDHRGRGAGGDDRRTTARRGVSHQQGTIENSVRRVGNKRPATTTTTTRESTTTRALRLATRASRSSPAPSAPPPSRAMEIPELGEHCAHAGEARAPAGTRASAPPCRRPRALLFPADLVRAYIASPDERRSLPPPSRPRLSERRMRPAGFLTVRVQRLRPDLLPRAPREPRVRRLRRDRLGDVRRVPALRREREARPGRRHPRHLRQARGVSPMRPLEAPGDDAAVPRPGMQRKTRRRERVQVQGVPRGGVPRSTDLRSRTLRHSPRPATARATPPNRRTAGNPSIEPNRRVVDRAVAIGVGSTGGSRPHADPSRGSGRVHVVRGPDAPPTKTTPAGGDASYDRVGAAGDLRRVRSELPAPRGAHRARRGGARGGRGDRGAGVGGRRGGGGGGPRWGRVLGRRRAGGARRIGARGGRVGGGGGARTSKRPPRSSASCASVCAEANERVNTLGVCDNAREAFRRYCESTDDTTPSGDFESITATFATSTSTRVRTARTLDTSRSRTPLPNPVLLPKMRMFRQIKQSGFSVLEGIWDLRKNSRIVLRTPL